MMDFLKTLLLLLVTWTSSMFTFLSAQSLQVGQPFIHHFSTDDYNAGIQNWAFVQDKRGIIYVANNFGVLAYDGTRWTKHMVKNGSKVRDLAIGNNGSIFIANQGDFGILSANDFGGFEYKSLADSLNKNDRNFDETWKVFITAEQTFFCSFDKLFIYENEELKTISYDSKPEDFFYINHSLFTSIAGKGLFQLNQKRFELVRNGDFFKDQEISGIMSESKNRLIVVTSKNGAYLYNGIDIAPWKPLNIHLKGYVLTCSIRLRNGNYVFGTENNGIIVTSPEGELLFKINKSNGLYDRKVLSLFEDNNNNLWIGHNNGISFIELDQPFFLINENQSLPGTGYTGHIKDSIMYLGTSNGLYYKKLSSSSDKFQLVSGSKGQVYSLVEIGNDLFMGHHEGSFQVKGNTVKSISRVKGSWTFQPLKSNPEYVLCGTYEGFQLLKKDRGQWTLSHEVSGFKESSRVIEQDAFNNIWMTHGYKGVFKVRLSKDLRRAETVEFYDREAGLPGNALINVFRIQNDLVFTTEKHIYKYDSVANNFSINHAYPPELGLPEALNFLSEDAFGNIYFISEDSVGVLSTLSPGQYAVNTTDFNKIKNLMNDDLQNINILNGRFVLYGAKEGFIIYDPNHQKKESKEYYTLIRQVELDHNDSIIFGGNFVKDNSIVSQQSDAEIPELPFKFNSIKFTYSTPFLNGMGSATYQIKLEGFDTHWSDWESVVKKEYTNLKEGRYVFKVKGKNMSNVVSKEASYVFVIQPPWYRNTIAYLGYIICIIITLFIAFRVLDRKHQKEKAHIQNQSSRELDEIDNKLREITEKSEAEIEHLKNEKLQSEINHKNKELASSTMHLINKNEFISNLKSSISSLVKKAKTQEVRAELNKLVKNIDRNISQDNDWEQFDFHFDQVHGGFSHKLHEKHPDLSPQEMKISALVRMNLSTKEIAHLLNISVRGVEVSRYRLRKRLGLERQTNLTEYLMNF